MLSRENTNEQVEDDLMDHKADAEVFSTDDQMDYKVSPTESITGATCNDEVQLTDEFAKCMLDYDPEENFKVPASLPIRSVSKLLSQLDNELTHSRSAVDNISLIDDEVKERAIFFVGIFVKELERKIFEYSQEAKPGSKIKKIGKIIDQTDKMIKSVVPPGIRLIPDKINECMGDLSAKNHKRKAKKLSAVVMPLKSDMRKILVRSGLEIFQNFEEQMSKVTDDSWKRGIEKLAIDAASRVKDYIPSHSKEKELSVDLITQGVVLGESKADTMTKSLLHKPGKLLNSKKFQLGYEVINNQNGEVWITSELYTGVGIKKDDDESITYYQSRKYNHAEKYGYRLPFAWELEIWSNENICKEYKLVSTQGKQYVYILDEEKKKKLANDILKEINGKDPVEKKI